MSVEDIQARQQQLNARTELFLAEQLPEFFSVDSESDMHEAFSDYQARAVEVAGNRGDPTTDFRWGAIINVRRRIFPDESLLQADGRIKSGPRVFHDTGQIALKLDGEEDVTWNVCNGTFMVTDERGRIVNGNSRINEEVDPSYGNPTPYVLEKLGWAKLIDVLGNTEADRGVGYEMLTDYLRKIGRIGATVLPHVGMDTLYSESSVTNERRALSYASASNFTLNGDLIKRLLSDSRFFELYRRDLNAGLFTNIADWLAGRLDSLVAHQANNLANWRNPNPHIFPYLDTPEYVNVNNN